MIGRRLVPALLLVGCTVTPLTNKIRPGEEGLVIVVGEGADGATDLFAAPADGGSFTQLTFNRLAEDRPRLAPSGKSVAFTRQAATGTADLVVLDLSTMAESSGTLPGRAGGVTGLGWTPAGDTVVVVASAGRYLARVAGPRLELVAAPAALDRRLDSLAAEQIGDPPFGTIGVCRSGLGGCVTAKDGAETRLDPDARDPIRWGPNALAYLLRGRLEIRPLVGGRARQPTWVHAPAGLRQPTHHPGSTAR